MSESRQPLMVTESQAEQVASAVSRVLGMRGVGVKNSPSGITLTRSPRTRRDVQTPEGHDYVITGASRDGSNFRWIYSVKLAVPPTGDEDGWTWGEVGEETIAINKLEVINGTSGMTGSGIDIDELSGTGLELQRAPDGAIVFCRQAGKVLAFEFANPVGGSCA